MMQPLLVSLKPQLSHPETLVAIEVQLREPVFVKLQQALQRYGHHNADSLFAEAITHYLTLLTIIQDNSSNFRGWLIS